MGRVDTGLVGQQRKSLQRSVLECRELLGVLESEQVGAPGGTDEEASAGEHGGRHPVDQNEITRVFRCVAGGVQRPDRESGAALELLEMKGGYERESGSGPGRQDEVGARLGRQSSTPGEVVVVDVGFEDVCQRQVADLVAEPVDVALRVDDDGVGSVTNDVGRITEAGGAYRADIHVVVLL